MTSQEHDTTHRQTGNSMITQITDMADGVGVDLATPAELGTVSRIRNSIRRSSPTYSAGCGVSP